MAETSPLYALALDALGAAEAAAIAAARLAGRGDKTQADQVAVDAMRRALNAMAMRGRIVIGEGERDEAPMLYIGEAVGTGEGPEIDIALDPLEGTDLTAKAGPGALAVLALSPRGGLLHAPDTYMDKIAVGPGLPEGVVDLDLDPAQNIARLAEATGRAPADLCALVLERERHAEIIAAIRRSGAKVQLIPDGDVAGVIAVADPQAAPDIYLGQGGAPEGVLGAAALKSLGGQFQGRLVFRNADERGRAERVGLTDLDRKYALNELASGECLFIAAGVTDGPLLSGVRFEGDHAETQALILSSAGGLRRRVTTRRRM